MMTMEVRLPASQSLKDKRAVVRSVLDGARRRFAVAAAETHRQDDRQRGGLAFVAVAGEVGQVVAVLDRVERFVWSFPELEVVDACRHWVETD
jgi:uncharacterized protein